MTVEHGSSLDGTETAMTASRRTPTRGRHSAGQGSARSSRLATIRRLDPPVFGEVAFNSRDDVGRCRRGSRCRLCTSFLYRPDQQVGDAAAHRAIQAASDGAVAVLSYSYDHLDRDFANAKSHLTGDFLAYYSKFTDDIVAPTAQQGQLTTTAKVVRAAVSDLHPDSAVVLVFVDQTTASMEKKDPVKTESASWSR